VVDHGGRARLTDQLRSESARQRREAAIAEQAHAAGPVAPGADETSSSVADDSLVLLLMCCHPALSPASQIALTLRAVGGLTTGEVARAFLVPEATMTRRITRAKQRVADTGATFALPVGDDRTERLGAALHVLYLIFNEGYAATSGPQLHRVELSGEAIRLARMVHHLLPDDPEVTGLLALMLLTDARRAARSRLTGDLVPMAEQDRRLWNADQIGEGVALLSTALSQHEPGPYQLQAATAAVHDEAPTAEATDWPQIVALYELMMHIDDSPLVALNHAVAVAMVDGARAGLGLVDTLRGKGQLGDDHRLYAVGGHLLELAGDAPAARTAFTTAAQLTANLPQQRYLNARADRAAKIS